MKHNVSIATDRLKKVLLSDKISQPDKFNELIKSDVLSVLNNYFELYPSTFEVKITFNEDVLDFTLKVKGNRIKPYGNFISEEK